MDVFEAAAIGDTERVAALLDADPRLLDVVSRHPIGVTPLHAALFGRRREAARMLIDAGADVSARRGGAGRDGPAFTPLHEAAASGQVELARLLLDRGADPGGATDDGRTALELARRAGNEAVAELLVGRIARP